MATRKVTCPQCGREYAAEASRLNRAVRVGLKSFCGQACFGLSRRLANPPTEDERRARKAEYDRQYRAKHVEKRREQHARWYRETADVTRAKHAAYRKANMKRHVAYCQRPEYRAKKAEYDRGYRATTEYGEFGDAFRVLMELEREIDSRASRYDIYAQNGTLNKAQRRRRGR